MRTFLKDDPARSDLRNFFLKAAGIVLLFPVHAIHVIANSVCMFAGILRSRGAVLDLTWGVVFTGLGLGFGLLQILFGATVSYGGGNALIFKSAPLMTGGGVSLGPVLFGNGRFDQWEHEYGHTIQNRMAGPFFVLIGLASLLSASLDGARWKGVPRYHRDFITERSADKYGGKYYC